MLPQLGGDSGDYNQRQILDAYWEFVRENPQDFNGWAYLIQVGAAGPSMMPMLDSKV